MEPGPSGALARRGELALAEALSQTALRCGGVAQNERGLLLVAGTHPCPVLVNSALRTGTMDAQAVVDHANRFFRERGRGYDLWTRVGPDADLEQAAIAAGLRPTVELRAMVLERSPAVDPPGDGITIHQVADESDMTAFRDVVADGFKEEAPDMEGLIHSIFSDSRALLAPDTAAFVVMDRGVPVSAAMTMVCGQVAWIGWVATRVGSRGRGLGRLATTAATRAGFRLGATLASLEATADGVPVYLRIGFHEVARFRNYCPPPTTSPI